MRVCVLCLISLPTATSDGVDWVRIGNVTRSEEAGFTFSYVSGFDDQIVWGGES